MSLYVSVKKAHLTRGASGLSINKAGRGIGSQMRDDEKFNHRKPANKV